MFSEELQRFIRENLRSLWEIELLLLVSRDRGRSWSADEINSELRASRPLVANILATFKDKGLVREDGGRFSFEPATAELAAAVEELKTTYQVRPLAVVKAIVSARDEKIQKIADAFRIKKD